MKYLKLKVYLMLPFLVTLQLIFCSTPLLAQGDGDLRSGKVRVNTTIDGVQREYLIHIPANYDATKPVPLVFVLHGTSGDGDVFYNSFGWKELSEEEGFIPVFPSSGRYKINSNGEIKTTTKWNVLPDTEWTLEPGQQALDDIKFLRTIIQEMKLNYNIDARRIYLNGFSNGGQMAAKCAVEMSDELAAVVENAGSFFLDTVYIPKRKLPLLYQIGNKDYGPGNEGPEVPLIYLDTLISTPGISVMNGKHYQVALNHRRNFDLQDEFQINGDTSFAVAATYQPNNPGPGTGYEFVFVLVKGLAHQYPNGNNHKFNAPVIHWNWLKKYVLEEAGSGELRKLSAIEGYGGGDYKPGSRVHIWSKQKDGQVFTHWSGDTSYLDSPFEYHTVVTMPDKDISVFPNYATLASDMQLSVYNIKGAERTKKILAYFPSSGMKGLVWFFHGTNGNATNFTSDIEARQLINLLMTKGYGIVGYTSEESEFNLDFDMDGNLRYTYGMDSTLLDFANIRAIRDTFVRRGNINSGTEHIAIGYSAGGGFAEFVVNVLNWRAAVGHNVPGTLSLSTAAVKPWLLSISLNDRNPGVGEPGNELARIYQMNYKDRGVCTSLHEFQDNPLFPERFDRSSLISETLSKAIFNEIKSNNILDNNNYFIPFSDELEQIVLSNPAKFPVIRALTPAQLRDVQNQVQVTNAEHNFKADINGMSVKFIEEICGTTTDLQEVEHGGNTSYMMPNPASDIIYLSAPGPWQVFNTWGRLMSAGNGSEIPVDTLTSGLYMVVTGKVKQLIAVVH